MVAIVSCLQAFTDGEITCKGDLVGTRVEDFVIPNQTPSKRSVIARLIKAAEDEAVVGNAAAVGHLAAVRHFLAMLLFRPLLMEDPLHMQNSWPK